MDDSIAAITGGTIGTLAMLVILYGASMATGYTFQAPEIVASMINAPTLLGLALFVSAGVVLWPLLYTVFGFRLPGAGSNLIASELVMALVLWAAFTVGFSQQLGRGDFALFVVVGLIAHLAYGAILGATYQQLGEGRQVPS
jgi:hypothetical protein